MLIRLWHKILYYLPALALIIGSVYFLISFRPFPNVNLKVSDAIFLDKPAQDSSLQSLSLEDELIVALVIGLFPLLNMVIGDMRLALINSFLLALVLIPLCLVIFQFFQILLPLFYLEIALFLGTSFSTVAKATELTRDKDFVDTALSQYVSPQIIKDITNNPNKLSLRGQTKDITVMFLDIRDFTNFSEQREPDEVVKKLNQLLNLASKIIIKHQGTIDKYIGDCIMALWGAPTNNRHQGYNASLCALELNQKVNGLTKFQIGIGLNSGKAVVGNIGSEERFNYTAVGDSVNLAARLESATKDLNQSIVISDQLKQRLKKERKLKEFHFIDLGSIKVRGKSENVKVWSISSKLDHKLLVFSQQKEAQISG